MSASTYSPDVLGPDFSRLTIAQPDDYEGRVVCTLVRHQRSESSRRAVLFVHGFNDYFFQREMAERYACQGYQFYALELRKYGRSLLPHQRPNNVRDLREYYPDLDAALTQVQAEGHATIVLSGHSTGGLVVALYAQDGARRTAINALFLNSPFLEYNLGWLLKNVGLPVVTRLARLNPDLSLAARLPDNYGRSLHQQYHGVWDYNLAWKPIDVFPVNFGWLRAILAGHQRVRHGLQLPQPILVMHSDKSTTRKSWTDDYLHSDGVLNVRHIRDRAPLLGLRVTVVAIAGGLHDLMLSSPPVRQHAYQELFRWLKRTLG